MDREQRSMPKYFREVRYQQNRSVSPARQAMKEKRREQRKLSHQKIMKEYQQNYKYYDQSADEWLKQGYYQDLPKNPSYDELHKLVSSTFRHARRRENIFPIVDRHPDYTLRCVYSGIILSDAEGNFMEKCDEEHSFPQSFQRGSKAGTGRDMHAIFAASKSANGSRGNMPFGCFPEQQIIDNNKCGTVFGGAKFFKKTVVPANNQGAIARSTLYILICYKGAANPSYLPKQTLGWLIETASTAPISQWEKHRNQELHRLQGNRNPFIDYPNLARIIDFSFGWQK